MPVLLCRWNEEDHAWHSYVLLMLVGYDSSTAQNVENLFMEPVHGRECASLFDHSMKR